MLVFNGRETKGINQKKDIQNRDVNWYGWVNVNRVLKNPSPTCGRKDHLTGTHLLSILCMKGVFMYKKIIKYRLFPIFVAISLTSFISIQAFATLITFSLSSSDTGTLSNGDIIYDAGLNSVTHDFQDGETFFMRTGSFFMGPSPLATGPLVDDQHTSTLAGSWIVNGSLIFPFTPIEIHFVTFAGGFSNSISEII